MNYEQISATAVSIGERNDCAVRAVALVSGREYGAVHSMFAHAGRVRGQGTCLFVIAGVIADLGGTLAPVKHMGQTIGKLNLGRGTYLVRTRGHILAVVDGVVQDYTRGRRHRVVDIKRVVFDNPVS